MLKAFCVLLCVFTFPHHAFATNSFIERLHKAKNSIVEIQTVYTKPMHGGPLGRMVTYARNAAGIVIDASGIVVTNTHTIINAPHIFVRLRNGTKLVARVVFTSVHDDFSLLKINPSHPLKAIAWADSQLIKPGQNIIGIGNSDYDHQSILTGQVISLVKNRKTGKNELIQVNLNLYHGDSGGPILDENCRLLGMVMAKEKTKDRSSLAIASNAIRKQYVQYKKTTQ